MTAIHRRDFLKSSAGLAALLAAGPSMPGFLASTAAAAQHAEPGERVLVIVQLSGGNDGLNTVIPYRSDQYHRLRPTLRVAPSQVHAISDDLGLHPEMVSLKSLHDDGLLCTVNSVGYPNPDRSHFRSMDIWHTASQSPESQPHGWIGRLADLSSRQQGSAPTAVHLDDGPLPLALRASRESLPSIPDLSRLRIEDPQGIVQTAVETQRSGVTDDLLYVQRVSVAACRNAARVEQVLQHEPSRSLYPDTGLARRLAQISTLIAGGFGARVYYTSLNGFDTHAQQALSHGGLLRELADALAAFQRDLQARGLGDRVLTMTFSEFGRRVAENAGKGTDHGAAAPLLIVGNRCKPGIVNPAPDLSSLVDGDLAHRVDFRSVYAGLLSGWLGVRAEPVIGPGFEPLRVTS